MKKRIVSIICIVGFLLTVCLSGCLNFIKPDLTHPREYYGFREVGDFKMFFYTNDTCAIVGTTEQGNTKRFLVIPEKIEDSPVEKFCNVLLSDDLNAPDIKSKALEKIYLDNDDVWLWYYYKSDEAFDCPNLKKIMHIKRGSPKFIYDDSSMPFGSMQYFPRLKYEEYVEEYQDIALLNAANVSYYYNYEDAENDGYYWIDDCDYGGKIEFIPEVPVREGYDFGGWYKEPECENEWNFETDSLPQEKTDENNEQIYQETTLYAKWIEKL